MTIIRFCFNGIPNNEISEHLICHNCPFSSWDRTKGKNFCTFHDAEIIDKIFVLNHCFQEPEDGIRIDNHIVLTQDSYQTVFRLLGNILTDLQSSLGKANDKC